MTRRMRIVDAGLVCRSRGTHPTRKKHAKKGRGRKMGWAIGYDTNWNRDIGYGVPSICDYPDCQTEIDRGLSYVCGGEPYGGEEGCGLYFCGEHLDSSPQQCERCINGQELFTPKPDKQEWTDHKGKIHGRRRLERADRVSRF